MMKKSEFFAWVQALHHDCVSAIEEATVRNTDPSILQDFTEFMHCEVIKNQRTEAQGVVLYIWDQLPSGHEARGAYLEWGTVGIFPNISPHVWIRVPAPELLGDDGLLAEVDQDVIIDPACPGVSPSCLLIHRRSPLWRIYNAKAAAESRRSVAR